MALGYRVNLVETESEVMVKSCCCREREKEQRSAGIRRRVR